jgi:hypothetical protein
MEKQTSDEALKIALDRSMHVRPKIDLSGHGTTDWKAHDNRKIAHHTLRYELGDFADRPPPYHLDQDKRDMLLVHARQDAKHALLNTISLMEEVHRLKETRNHYAYFLLFGLVAIALWRYWPFIKEWLDSAGVPSK